MQIPSCRQAKIIIFVEFCNDNSISRRAKIIFIVVLCNKNYRAAGKRRQFLLSPYATKITEQPVGEGNFYFALYIDSHIFILFNSLSASKIANFSVLLSGRVLYFSLS